jgi:transcriptional regulator with XRE-family HTH domain
LGLKKSLSKSLHSPEWKLFCIELKEMRKAKRLTQAELALKLGERQSYVNKVETGERMLDLRQFVIYARALNSDPARTFRLFLKIFDATQKK